ncbi:S-adenosyl-L-methionine-dependent methyltransferase [Aspergillus tamarii]|uniref:S-adenosyl-L-methionine-dependent methyltransferase n=1 Tax=Aspergillus tamarii TaxID=41984 RepID=A0A5N6UEW6_ASPTM|nr:S-adenosyl-L-methionine-dependent methyltransferase [Aspergillus tamarii]
MLDNFEPVVRFLAHYQGDEYVKGWAELWDKGDFLDWDKGFPNPALEDTLIQRRSIIGDPIVEDAEGNQYRRKALVPGCGRGVDVLLLASFGYDAYGLEYSHSAVETCKKEESETEGRYPIRNPSFGRGRVTFVQGDFFDDAWLDTLGLQRYAFDLVYDHSVCRPSRLSC